MYKYNLKSHCVDEQPTIENPDNEIYTENWRSRKLREYKEHIASLRSIPVSGEVDWKDEQELKENYDFLMYRYGGPLYPDKERDLEGYTDVAVPLPLPIIKQEQPESEDETNMNIIEGNKSIAEFMGAEWVEDDYGDWGYKHHLFPSHFKYWAAAALKYHSSWDWLHPAWDKFRDLKLSLIDEGWTDIYSRHCMAVSTAIHAYPIQEAFERLVKAINWYNKSK